MSYTLAELIELKEVAKAAYIASSKALSYKIGNGGSERGLVRNDSDKAKADLDYWTNLIAAHPDTIRPSNAVRRVRYFRTC